MRAGARLKTMIQTSKKLSRADPEKTNGVSVPASLGLNTDEPAQIQPRVTRKPKCCGWDDAEGLWALYSTQSGLQGQLHLRIRHYDKAEVH